MTDNRTTDLRISEPLRGFIRHQSNRAYIDGEQARWLTEIADKIDAKHEQAITATLGEADEGCYLMYEGKKYPAELDFGFLGLMPITITVGGFRYLVEVPNGEQLA